MEEYLFKYVSGNAAKNSGFNGETRFLAENDSEAIKRAGEYLAGMKEDFPEDDFVPLELLETRMVDLSPLHLKEISKKYKGEER